MAFLEERAIEELDREAGRTGSHTGTIHRWVVHRRIRHAARGVIGRIAKVDIADVSAGELFSVDVDVEAVVVDQ